MTRCYEVLSVWLELNRLFVIELHCAPKTTLLHWVSCSFPLYLNRKWASWSQFSDLKHFIQHGNHLVLIKKKNPLSWLLQMLLCVGEGRKRLHHVPSRFHWAKTVQEKGRRGLREVTYSTFSVLPQRKLSTPLLKRKKKHTVIAQLYMCILTHNHNNHPSFSSASCLCVAMVTSNGKGWRLKRTNVTDTHTSIILINHETVSHRGV